MTVAGEAQTRRVQKDCCKKRVVSILLTDMCSLLLQYVLGVLLLCSYSMFHKAAQCVTWKLPWTRRKFPVFCFLVFAVALLIFRFANGSQE